MGFYVNNNNKLCKYPSSSNLNRGRNLTAESSPHLFQIVTNRRSSISFKEITLSISSSLSFSRVICSISLDYKVSLFITSSIIPYSLYLILLLKVIYIIDISIYILILNSNYTSSIKST